MSEAARKQFALKQCTLTESPYSDENLDFNTKCSLAIQRIADEHLSKNGERKLIFVGYTIVPILLSLYKYLRERNITVESRMVGFNPGKTVLTEHEKIEEYYNKWLKLRNKTTKNEKKNTPDIEIGVDEKGEQSVTLYKHSVIIEEDDDNENAEIVGIEESDEKEAQEDASAYDKDLVEKKSNDNKKKSEKNTSVSDEQIIMSNICPKNEKILFPAVIDSITDDEIISHENKMPIKEEKTIVQKAKDTGKKFFNNTVNGIGKVAGKKKDNKQPLRFQDSNGNNAIEKPRTREELEKSIFKGETKAVDTTPEYSKELIQQLQAYEQLIENTKRYFCRQLKTSSMDNKDFYTFINLIQVSETKEALILNSSIELPVFDIHNVSDKLFNEYKIRAIEITEETNKFNII